MCFKIGILILVIALAHVVSKFVPSQTHWRFQGKAMPNSTVLWSPRHVPPHGMFFVHVKGHGYFTYNTHNVSVSGDEFFHSYGNLPEIKYFSQKEQPLKAEMHLIAGI